MTHSTAIKVIKEGTRNMAYHSQQMAIIGKMLSEAHGVLFGEDSHQGRGGVDMEEEVRKMNKKRKGVVRTPNHINK
jgi:hypothetical protein